MEAGDKINTKLGQWTFSGGVHKVFDNHIRKSVPAYEMAHEIILLMSDNIISNQGKVLDLGCTTGNLLFDFAKRHKDKNLNLLGIDCEGEMIEHCYKKFEKMNGNQNLEFLKENINTFDFPDDVDIVTMIYTLQFIHPKYRQDIINRIYKSLNWGGGFFFFEKVRGPDARFQDYLTHAYHQYKIKNFNKDEILTKSESLVGVLEPFSTEGNLGLLKRAGFQDIAVIFKAICFEGVLAIK